MHRGNIKINLTKTDGFAFNVVVIAMVITSMLVITGLALSSANFYMKITEERGINSKFSAEKAINEIRLGIENDYTRILEECYREVLASSATIPAEKIDDEMKKLVVANFEIRFTGGCTADRSIDLDYFDDPSLLTWRNKEVGGKIVNDHIYSYLIHTAGVTIERYPDFIADYANDKFIFKGISVSYQDVDGVYSGKVTTDIVVNTPKVFQSDRISNKTEHTYEAFSLIANDKLFLDSTKVSGKIYAGVDKESFNNQNGIEIGEKNDGTVIINDDVITRGNINVNPGGILKIINPAGTIYAKGISTSNSGAANIAALSSHYNALDINSKIYLNGDTSLNVPFADVKLSGEYYGYNASSNSDSSSFIINASNIEADLTGLKRLFIGGTSFLDIPIANEESQEVITGESLTGKFSQGMYLVPSSCILVYKDGQWVKGTNPITAAQLDNLGNIAYEGDLDLDNQDSNIKVDLRLNSLNGGIDLLQYTLEDDKDLNGLTEEEIQKEMAKMYYKVLTVLVNKRSIDRDRYYLYLKFPSKEKAASYAVTYQAYNLDYIDKRAKSFKYGPIVLGNDCSISTAGNVISTDRNGNVKMREFADPTSFADVAKFNYTTNLAKFNSLCSNLGTKNVQIMSDSLYEEIIDKAKVVEGNLEINNSSVRASKVLVYYDDVVSEYSGETYSLLVTSGNVEIVGNFQGVIIAGGKISSYNNGNKVVGLLISGGNIEIYQSEFTNTNDLLEKPAQYLLEFWKDRNVLRKFFKNMKLYDEQESVEYYLQSQGLIQYERWNTR